MSLKLHLPLDFSPENMGAVSDESGLYQDISEMAERYSSKRV